MQHMLSLQIKALCSPFPHLTVPCKCVMDMGWVLPQLAIAFERIKSFQHTQHHSYAELRGAFPQQIPKYSAKDLVSPSKALTVLPHQFLVTSVTWLSWWKNTAQQAVYCHKINWFHICKCNQTSLLFVLIGQTKQSTKQLMNGYKYQLHGVQDFFLTVI